MAIDRAWCATGLGDFCPTGASSSRHSLLHSPLGTGFVTHLHSGLKIPAAQSCSCFFSFTGSLRNPIPALSFQRTQETSFLGTPSLRLYVWGTYVSGFPGGLVVKNPPANTGDLVSLHGSGRSRGEGNGNSLQYSCLGNPMDRGAWWATVQGVTKGLDRT